MAPSGFMMDARRLTKTALDVRGHLQVRLHHQENDTLVGYIEDPRLGDKDDIGALYYVIAVIFIYGLSIVMMIASHIRRNKQDCQLRAYLKEMAVLRKADRRDKLMGRITTLAATDKVKNVFKNSEEQGNGKGLFKLSSKSSFKIGSQRNSKKEAKNSGEKQDGKGGPGVWNGGGAGAGVGAVLMVGGSPGAGGTPTTDTPLVMKTEEGLGDDVSRQDDGNETADSEFLELPVDFTLDLNRLSPSANVSPLTSASATPSPPPRRELKPKTKICFEEEGFVL